MREPEPNRPVILIGEAATDGLAPVVLRAAELVSGDESRVAVLTDGCVVRAAVGEWVGVEPPGPDATHVNLRTWDEGPRPGGWFYGRGGFCAWPQDLIAVRIAAEASR